MTSERREEDRSGLGEESAGSRRPAAADDAAERDPAVAAVNDEPGVQEDTSSDESELEQFKDRYLRLAAEFDNYRKRTERERNEHSVRAQGRLVQGMLDAIDDLERVADFTPDTTTVEALLEGVQMVERKLLRALEGAGLELMDARGAPFNPEVHEALMTAATDHAHEDDTVGEVFQKGYRFQGHLLRPARVQVRKHSG